VTDKQRWIAGWLVVMAVAGYGSGATVDELLAKAQTQSLTGDECGQLSQALAEKVHSAKWLDIASALKANWSNSTKTAWGQAVLVKGAVDGYDADQKVKMIAALHVLYAADGPVLKTMDTGEATELAKILFALGDTTPASDLLAGWMGSTTNGRPRPTTTSFPTSWKS